MLKHLWPLFLLASMPAHAFEVIAHRGVHQTFTREGLTMTACTARMIFPPKHDYLENTTRSVRRAFELGATTVEIDVHPTRDNRLAVFHDWTLECRTNASCKNGCQCNSKGTCVTSEQTWDYLRSLDIGYGYTADGGRTFPFRTRRTDVMPSLEEMISLLEAEFPDGKLLVNVKGGDPRTTELFAALIHRFPEKVRARILFPRTERAGTAASGLDALGVGRAISQSEDLKKCIKSYVLSGAVGHFPEACRGKHLAILLEDTLALVHPWLGFLQVPDLIWGWPERFLALAHANGTKIYPAQVNSLEALAEVTKLPFDGIMTDRIEELSAHLP